MDSPTTHLRNFWSEHDCRELMKTLAAIRLNKGQLSKCAEIRMGDRYVSGSRLPPTPFLTKSNITPKGRHFRANPRLS